MNTFFDEFLSTSSIYIENYKFVATFLIVFSFLLVKRTLIHIIRLRSKKRGEDRRHQINLTKQLANALLVVILIMFWSSEVHNLAISIAAFMVAIVLAVREYIQCFIGFIYYMFSRPFRVGDWVQIDQQVGEVVEIDWAKTSMLEVNSAHMEYTGRHVHIPNNQIITRVIKNLNFMRRYRLHKFSIVNEPTVNAYSLIPQLMDRAAHRCADFKEVAIRYKSLIERSLDQEFISIIPVATIHTNQFAKLVVDVSIFCPTDRAEELEQNISADWMLLWHEELERLDQKVNTYALDAAGGSNTNQNLKN